MCGFVFDKGNSYIRVLVLKAVILCILSSHQKMLNNCGTRTRLREKNIKRKKQKMRSILGGSPSRDKVRTLLTTTSEHMN